MPKDSLKKKIGESVTEFFLIKSIEKRYKKSDNSPYLVLELGYAHGRIWGHIWDETDTFLEEYNEGDILKIQGFMEEYREQTQINIKKLRKSVASDNIYPEDLLPEYQGDRKNLGQELEDTIKSISDNFLRDLCSRILLDNDFGEEFGKAPGGKLWHHSYVGGLLEHTLSVAKLCLKAADLYPEVKRDLICSGALLHDVGKVKAYTSFPYFDYTDEGRLIGHVVIGHDIVKEKISGIRDFPEETAKQLLHLILSHQGALEKASPVVPMTLEGIILHFSDETDSQSNAFLRIREEQKTPQKKWSNYVNLADRFFYFGPDNDEQTD